MLCRGQTAWSFCWIFFVFIEGSIMCYKDGSQLPPLNFTTICKDYVRHVIFYNKRIDGFTYPEVYEIYNVYTDLREVNKQSKNLS